MVSHQCFDLFNCFTLFGKERLKPVKIINQTLGLPVLATVAEEDAGKPVISTRTTFALSLSQSV